MTRKFKTLDDGCLVEVTERNKRKYKADKEEDQPVEIVSIGAIISWFVIGLFGFLFLFIAGIFQILGGMIKKH